VIFEVVCERNFSKFQFLKLFVRKYIILFVNRIRQNRLDDIEDGDYIQPISMDPPSEE
jgi:hypothetical protein